MRVFVTVADAGAFTRAARELRTSPPSVTRAIAALEERLGARLFERTTRVVRLTDAGRAFVPECRRILAAVEEAEARVTGAFVEPRGELAVTAPALFGRTHVMPIVIDFLRRHAEVRARLAFVDRIVDLVEEGFDVAVRIGHLPDSSLTALRVGSVRQLVCASPRYLAERGIPRTLHALAKHDAIALSADKALHEWLLRAPGSRKKRVRVTPRVRLEVGSVDLAIAAAVAGFGLVRVLSYQVASELRSGKLQIMLPRAEPDPLPIQLVYPSGRRAPAKVRAFVELSARRLRAAPL